MILCKILIVIHLEELAVHLKQFIHWSDLLKFGRLFLLPGVSLRFQLFSPHNKHNIAIVWVSSGVKRFNRKPFLILFIS